jgi:hypothetical protein
VLSLATELPAGMALDIVLTALGALSSSQAADPGGQSSNRKMSHIGLA